MTESPNGLKPRKAVWYLVDAQMSSPVRDISAWAVCTCPTQHDPCRKVPLSVSRKGRIFELVRVYADASQPQLWVETGGTKTEPATVSIRKVSSIRAWQLMFRRLFTMFPKTTHVQRSGLGLTWKRILLDTYHSYRKISKLRAFYPAPSYTEWLSEYWQPSAQCISRLEQRLGEAAMRKLDMQVIVDLRNSDIETAAGPIQLSQLLDSLYHQHGPAAPIRILAKSNQNIPASWSDHERLSIVNENELISMLGNDNQLIVWLTPSVVLTPWALGWLKCSAASNPKSLLFYSDHDHLLPDGSRSEPRFKPDWSLEFARCSAYTGDLLMIRASALQQIAARSGLTSTYRMVLDAGCEWPSRVHHIPAVLWHSSGTTITPNTEELTAHLQQFNIRGSVQKDKHNQLRVKYDLPQVLPKVSIIIPTRDMLHFLKPCVQSLLGKSTWPNFEVLIVDNQSTCPKSLAYMQQVQKDERVRLLHYDKAFNFSSINNFAVEHAKGELVCLLNNDTEIISPDWLEEMVSILLQSKVGAVGARLYFSDGRVQHAGDVVGPGGCANHLHGIIEASNPGYMNRAILPQELSAVTAACLLTHRALFLELGGLNEDCLPVGFNDVDFCLRVGEAGYRVIYTPYAELYHHESVSRGQDNSAAKRARAKREADYLRRRWPHIIERDPYYNPNLNYSQPDFMLGKFPRTTWPW